MYQYGDLRETRGEVSVEWKIKGFFSLPKWTDYCKQSPVFLLSDAKWYLQIYPNGRKDGFGDTDACISLFLYRNCSSSEKHRVAWTLGIGKCDGSMYKSADFEFEFEKDVGYGRNKFLQISELQKFKDFEIPEDGSLTVLCTARTCADFHVQGRVVETSTQTESSKSFETLQRNFRDLFLSGHHGDVTINVKEQHFQVHRSILAARSRVFCSMFDHDTEEKRSGIVNISDCDPESFNDFLSFLYTGKMDMKTSTNAIGLYKVADKYDVKDLTNECVRCMMEQLSADSFCDVILLATTHTESDLLNIATDFFIENVKTILPTPEWQSLTSEHCTLTNELLIKMANKKL